MDECLIHICFEWRNSIIDNYAKIHRVLKYVLKLYILSCQNLWFLISTSRFDVFTFYEKQYMMHSKFDVSIMDLVYEIYALICQNCCMNSKLLWFIRRILLFVRFLMYQTYFLICQSSDLSEIFSDLSEFWFIRNMFWFIRNIALHVKCIDLI